MAIFILCQNLGAAVFLTLSQAIFSNTLRAKTISDALGVDTDAVLVGGVSSLRQLVSLQEIGGVVRAYGGAFYDVLFSGVALGCCAWLCAWRLGWKDIRKTV